MGIPGGIQRIIFVGEGRYDLFIFIWIILSKLKLQTFFDIKSIKSEWPIEWILSDLSLVPSGTHQFNVISNFDCSDALKTKYHHLRDMMQRSESFGSSDAM